MQWDKVKNVLITILLAVDLFLLGNFCVKAAREQTRTDELEDNLRMLISDCGLELSPSFSLPEDKTLIPLMLDRDRAAEEKMAEKMLGSGASRTEQDDGAVRFESRDGALEWSADGEVHGACTVNSSPSSASQARRLTKKLTRDWGLADDSTKYEADGLSVTVKGDVARQPVHNRQLLFEFSSDGSLTLSGRWSFGIPYATARENSVSCAAADALLSFAADAPKTGNIISMEVGYRMDADSSKRLQLTPTWKIVTSYGGYLVDCAKKTIISPE